MKGDGAYGSESIKISLQIIQNFYFDWALFIAVHSDYTIPK